MPDLQYALVAYVQNDLGHFVEELRRDLYPAHAHLPAHVTILPPRFLSAGSEQDAIECVRRAAAGLDAFEAEVSSVESFFPTTPTVFLRVSRAAYRFRELHDVFNCECLDCAEQWPYMPHMTIVKMPDLEQAEQALKIARQRWSQYRHARTLRVRQLTFVREGAENRWIDVENIDLREAVAQPQG